MTELELNRVDIRVGLSGALYFMDGSPQAVRQLRNLVSQVRIDVFQTHFLPKNFRIVFLNFICNAILLFFFSFPYMVFFSWSYS